MAKHDENKDVRALSRIAKITNDKQIKISKTQTIGIKQWGRIDFLTHYCGYFLIWDNSAGTGIAANSADNAERNKKRASKRENKQAKPLKNKKK